MRRSTVATLLTAAVVGLTSGSVTALVRGGTQDGGTEPVGATTRAGAPGRLLYLDDQVLHDGETSVTLDPAVEDVDRLVRAADGWVLAQHTGSTEPRARLWHVRPDGAAAPIAEAYGPWDLDPSGTRVVGTDDETGSVRAWTLDGRVVGDAGVVKEERAVVWSGNQSVVISGLTGNEGSWRLYRWPMGRGARLLDVAGLEDLVASRAGDLLVGRSSSEGYPTPAGPNTCLQVQAAPGPRSSETDGDDGSTPGSLTCDWLPMSGTGAVLSPDDALVLAAPVDTDGFGPTRAASFSATGGVRRDFAELALPALTTDVEWLDGEHLVLTVASDVELDDQTGTRLEVCGRRGGCETVVAKDVGRLLVGEQY